MSSYPVALPRRGARQDAPATFPAPLGGANGTVELPSRTAAVEGTGTRAAPGPRVPADGARGAIARVVAYLDNPWDWSKVGSRRNATPIAYAAARYVRQYVPNVAGISGFATSGDARTPTTTNVPEGAGVPGSAVPFSRKQIVATFAPDFDTRVWTVYTPREIIQKPQAVRRTLAGPSALRRMRRPTFPNLTVLPDTTTYGQVTATLNPQGAPSAAAGGVKLGRTGAIVNGGA